MADDLNDEQKEAVAAAVVAREMVWDLCCHDHINDTMIELGLVPSSAEVARGEHAASHVRETLVYPLHKILPLMSEAACRVIAETQLTRARQELSPEHLRVIAGMNAAIVEQIVRAVIGNLIFKGVLVLNSPPHQGGSSHV